MLHLVSDPVALLLRRDVHVLHAQRRAVCALQIGEDLAQRDGGPLRPEDVQVAGVAARGRAQQVQSSVQVRFFKPMVSKTVKQQNKSE